MYLPVHRVVAQDRRTDRRATLTHAWVERILGFGGRRAERICGVVEAAATLATNGVAIELVVVRRRTDELGLVRVGETAMGEFTALLNSTEDKEGKDEKRDSTEGARAA